MVRPRFRVNRSPVKPQPAQLFLIPVGTIEWSVVKNVTFFTIPL